MRVLVLTTQFGRLNGAERLGVELAEALNSREGWRADLGSIYGADMAGARDAEVEFRARGIKYFRYLSMGVGPGARSFLSAILRLRRLLKSEDYDIVETSQITPAILASWACWGLKARHVSGLHETYVMERFNGRKHKFWRFSVRGGRCARFYAISEYVRRQWIAYSATPPWKTALVLNAIPDDCFHAVPERDALRAELGLPPNCRIALFVGRLLASKGVDTAIDALGPLLGPENLALVYVGEWGYVPDSLTGEEQALKQAIDSAIEANGWSSRVRFLGRRRDVPRLMASSDVLIHPSHTEGFGLVLAEALAAGLPVVASHVDGIPEVLEETDSIQVPPRDPDLLRDAVLKTLRRPLSEAARAIEKGRERAEAFRMCHRIDALALLFTKVCEGQTNMERSAQSEIR